MAQLTAARLKEILREGAGQEEGVDLSDNFMDNTFIELGYDSLALLETVGRIEREFGISLGDDVTSEAETPRLLIDLVNRAAADSALAG